MRLVVVRHLPTEWNRADKLQGRADIEIATPDESELSRIAENRSRLEALGPFDRVVCSTLRRTAETARIYGYDVIERSPLLDEFNFGRFEGKSRKEFMAELGADWLDRPASIHLGERMTDLEERIRQFIRCCDSNSKVLAFTHGCWTRALKAIHETGSIDSMNRISVKNNEIHVFEF